MKRILMIGTGGTLACRRTQQGLVPVMSSAELLSFVPDARDICEVETLSLMNKDSTEIQPDDWLCMARCIRENYNRFDGFVLCHGTDTMAYTSAALGYLIQRSGKPIVVTGAQQPIDSDTTDARQNLLDGFRYAASGMPGVALVFDGEVMAGSRAKKTHTKSYNAFSSTNFPPLAAIKSGRIVQYIRPEGGGPQWYDELCERVGLLKLVPGTPPQTLETMLAQNDGLVIESFGTGGLPARFYPTLEEGVRAGKSVVMATQVPNEGSDMMVYTVGRDIKQRLGLMETFDMTPESAITKLMWALAQTADPAQVRELFYTPVGFDILTTE